MVRTVVHQSKPTLSRSSSSIKNARDQGRIVLFGLTILGIVLCYANVQLISSTKTTITTTTTTTLLSKPAPFFPDLPPPQPYPSLPLAHQQHDDPTMIMAWDTWAATPMVGSYRLSRSTNVHFPYLDLQVYYQEHQEHLPRFKAVRWGSGYPPALAVKESSPPPTTASSAATQYCVLTRKGNKFSASGVRANQDRISLIHYFNNDSDNNNFDWWMGLFDGHGDLGHVVSQYASMEIPKRLQEKLESPSGAGADDFSIEDSLKDIFLQVDKDMPDVLNSGTTGISIWKRSNRLYVSNVGDSKACVVRFDASSGENAQILYETIPHKPDSVEERKRIESVGGTVLMPHFRGDSARVLIPMDDGINEWALAMSRSLGDHKGKKYGVIAEPTTHVIRLDDLEQSNNSAYMVLAMSDGLVDRVPLIEVASYVALSFVPGSRVTPLEAAEQLVLKSSEGWTMDPFGDGQYRDDISLGVQRLYIS